MKKTYKSNSLTWIIFLTLLTCFGYLLYFTWFKWGDLLIDTFRDPLVVLKIINGKVLYRDIFYEYGLFTPYFLTLICKIFGFHLNTFVGCGIVITLLTSWLLYKISRFFLDEIISGLVVFTFLFVFAFGFYCYNGIFNFILPYSFAAIFLVSFICLATYFFIRFIFEEKTVYLLFLSIALLFALLCRIEMALLVCAGFIIAGNLAAFRNRRINRAQLWVLLLAPLFLGFLVYFIFLFKMKAFMGFKESIFDHILAIRNNPFVLRGLGLNDLSGNILHMLKSLFIHLSILFLLGAGSYEVSSFFLKEKKSRLRLFLAVILIILAFVFAGEFVKDFLQYRCLPLILLAGASLFFIKTFRSPDYKMEVSSFALFLVSMIMIMRNFFNTGPYLYGFYLLDLGLICYYAFFFKTLYGWLEKKLKFSPEPLLFSIVAVFFITVSFSWWGLSSQLYRMRTVSIRSPRGVFITWNNDVTRRCWEAIDYLNKNTDKQDTVIVLPEGGGINFFSERKNPLRYANIMPQNISMAGEDKIISQVFESHADYIVITQRSTLEYGAASFGVDYAINLNSWIKENYELIKLFGPYPYTSDEFGIALFKRKDSASLK